MNSADRSSATSSGNAPEAGRWRRLIARTRRKVNTGWWLEFLGPVLILYGVVAACIVLYLRSRAGLPWSLEELALAAGGIGLFLMAATWLVARRRFISNREAAVRLESQLQLDNALTAAEQGLADWPPLPAEPLTRKRGDGWAWNWPRLALPPVLAAGLLVAPFLIPIKPASAVAQAPHEPMAWQEMEEWLEQLEEEKVADEETLEELAEQIEELRETAPEEWFSHSSLEATDSLRESLERALSELEKHVADANMNLTALSQLGDQLGQGTKDQLAENFQEALRGLEMGQMPMNQDLLEQLKSIDPSQLKSLDPSQCQGMCDSLSQNSQTLQEMLSQCQGGNPFGSEETSESTMRMLGELQKQGMMPGQGGIQRGRGDAPMFHQDEESRLGTDNLERLTNEDLSRAAPADLLGLGETEHQIEETPAAIRSGGVIGSPGEGGNRVWESDLLPSEKAVLKRFYQ